MTSVPPAQDFNNLELVKRSHGQRDLGLNFVFPAFENLHNEWLSEELNTANALLFVLSKTHFSFTKYFHHSLLPAYHRVMDCLNIEMTPWLARAGPSLCPTPGIMAQGPIHQTYS